MSELNKKELIDFLKENLKIEYNVDNRGFGAEDIKSIKLKLCEEEISEIYID